MQRLMTTLAFSLAMISCGVQTRSQLHDIGTDLDPAKRTLEVMLGFKNTDLLDRQFKLLSRASGLSETLSLQLYGAVDLEGEYIEFLSTPGLKYGDIVTEGSVFKMTSTVYTEQLFYKIGDSLPDQYHGQAFEQSEKDGSLIAVSGHPGMSASAGETPTQNPQGSDPKVLIFLCKNISLKQPYTEEWRKIDCDLNVVNGKLQISYNKSAGNPQGTSFSFAAPPVL